VSVARTVLREQIKDDLLERILRGELRPGERLVETRLARKPGTSQAPVREALRDLQLMRLVDSEPFRGARVRAVDDAEFHVPILEAIRAGDVLRAGSEARKNVRRTERVVRRRMKAKAPVVEVSQTVSDR
jgi:DNA-binding GntR family transcriptional regulator